MNIYSQMLPSYKGDFSTRICKIKVLSLQIIKVQSKKKKIKKWVNSNINENYDFQN